MEIITRKQARDRSLNVYFTGNPCKYGHIACRNTTCGNCVECISIHNKEYYWENIEKRKEAFKDWMKEVDYPSYKRCYYQRNKERIKAQQRERNLMYNRKGISFSNNWAKKYPSRAAAIETRRRARLLNAIPLWVDHSKIQKIYDLANQITKETGIKHAVDHIIPLYGKDPTTQEHNVCGLHVDINLQVLTKSQNSIKSNFYIVS